MEEGTGYRLLQLFADGGVMMYPLLLCSLLALGIIIAKAYTLWVAHRRSRELLEQIQVLVDRGRIRDAMNLAESTPGPVAAILLTGLRHLDEAGLHGGRDVEKAIKVTGTVELGFLERGLVLLATISNVAPLLGFLGTVAGMIAAFGAIEQAGQVEASLVAGGIKIALITTAAGLTIAIPVNLAYNFFVTRIDKLIVDMEEGTAAVLNMMWSRTGVAAATTAAAPGTPAAQRHPSDRIASSIEDTEPGQPGPGLERK
ncbi:MAG: MotA/TolQ/ExbB proton channel family protein [Longimicrobiales bacterium]